jgi:DNA-binding transcriptional MocR family regulator
MFSKRTERLTGSLIREILAVAQQADVISFAGGLPASAALPRLDLEGMPGELAQYGASEGEPRLRALVARYARGLGLSCQADQVLILSGSQQALDLTAKLFIDEQTPIVTEAPTYLAALQVFNLFGAEIHGVAQQDGVLDPDALESALQTHQARLAYLIPSFQNPSGACYDARLRKQLAAVLDRSSAVVVEDDPYRELSFEGPAPAPLVANLQKAPWVYCGSFSKTLAPGLRLGFLIASPQLFTPLLRLKQAVDLHSNRPGQWLVSNWLEGGAYVERLDRLRAGYRARRDAMQQALERHFSTLADWQLPRGGLFFWLRLKRRCDTRERLQQALSRQVLFMPGEAFYPQPDAGLGHIRLNFSHATPERIDEGIARLAEVFADCGEP